MAQQKATIIENYKIHGTDTGSIEVQVALITERIKNLTNISKLIKKILVPREGYWCL